MEALPYNIKSAYRILMRDRKTIRLITKIMYAIH